MNGPDAAVPPASTGRRIAAHLLDQVALAVILCAVAALVGLGAGRWTALAAGTVAAVAFAVVQWILLGTRGATLGKFALGLRVVDAATSAPIGLARGLLRLLVLSVFESVGIVLVMVFLIGHDPRRQGWHDKMVNSVVVNASALPASALPVATPARAQGLASQAPQPVPGSPGSSGSPGGLPSPTAPTAASPRIGPVTPADPAAIITPVVATPRTDGGLVGPPPGLVSRPVSTPPRPPAPSSPAPRPPGGFPPAPPAGARPPAPVTPPVTPPVAPTVPSARLTPPPAVPAAPTVQPTQPTPTVPSARITPPTPSGPTAPAHRWTLRLSSGVSWPVQGVTLIGRDPEVALRPGAVPLAVADPALTVSKTHAALTPQGASLWLEDLASTHGVVVRRGADEMQVAPGVRTRLLPGDVLVLGVFSILVEAA